MREHIKSAIWSAVIASVLAMVLIPLGTGLFNVKDIAKYLHSVGRSLGGHICDGKPEFASVLEDIKKLKPLKPGDPHQEFEALYSSIKNNLTRSAACGHIEARVMHVYATCKGEFGYEKSFIVASQLAQNYDRDGDFSDHNSPFRSICKPPDI